MKHTKIERHPRVRLILTITAALVCSAALIALSIWMRPPLSNQGRPVGTTSSPAPISPFDPNQAAARNVSGMLLLGGLTCLLIAGAFTVMLINNIRQSKPAWQTQHKYPKRR